MIAEETSWKRFVLFLIALGLSAPIARSEELLPLNIHMLGAGEYRPIESLTFFKKHLDDHFPVTCTTSFGKDTASLDVMVVFLRRMKLPDNQMTIIRDHWETGKPIVTMRTGSHAFQSDDNAIFDRKMLSGNYRGSGSYTAPFTAITAPEKGAHRVLKGVGSMTSKGYYGNDKLAADADVLQVVESTKKTPLPVT